MKTYLKPLVVLLTLAAAACGAPPPVPQDNFYRLQVTAPVAPAATAGKTLLSGTLEVERLSADGLTAGRPIVYSNSAAAHELHEYHYHFWTEPPTVMLRDQLVAYLRGTNVAATVVTPELRARPDYILAGKIRRLERIVGSAPGAVLELELGLREAKTDKLMFVETYQERADGSTNTDTVGGTVKSLNEAMARIFARFVGDLSKI